MSTKIVTLHPQGKQGVNIDRNKYELIKYTIMNVVESEEEISFGDLVKMVKNKLAGRFEGSIAWYVTTVKLDLEARGMLIRTGQSPQQLRLTGTDII